MSNATGLIYVSRLYLFYILQKLWKSFFLVLFSGIVFHIKLSSDRQYEDLDDMDTDNEEESPET